MPYSVKFYDGETVAKFATKAEAIEFIRSYRDELGPMEYEETGFKFVGICDVCYDPVFEDQATPLPRIAHIKCGPAPKTVDLDKVKAVEALILRGATEGEREAARSAYKRLTGKNW